MKKLFLLLALVVAVASLQSCASSKYGTYKVKKKGCMTKTRYKGPKQTYRSTNW